VSLAEKTLKNAQIIHKFFLFASVAYLLLPLYLVHGAKADPQPQLVVGIAVASAGVVVVAAFYRSKIVKPGADALRNNVDDSSAAAKWRSGTLISLAMAESVILFGLSLRFIHISWRICGIFYVLGFLLLLAWTPKLDLPIAQAE
jgi:F0F1-type ATP synthase membrane subunit c/vacuolar-type H+-ATPase subunit K